MRSWLNQDPLVTVLSTELTTLAISKREARRACKATWLSLLFFLDPFAPPFLTELLPILPLPLLT